MTKIIPKKNKKAIVHFNIGYNIVISLYFSRYRITDLQSQYNGRRANL